MSSLVSIIIPVYNADKYILRCLKSIVNQTFKNYECIIIDDGSSDESRKIINNYINNLPNFYYYYQPNSGPSSARNNAITKSKGQYIVFIDSDDFIETDYIRDLYDEISKGYDIVITGYRDISKYGEYNCNDFTGAINKATLIKSTIHGTGGVLWGKIFKKDIISNHKLFLDEKIFMSEDLLYVLEYIKYVDSWSILNKNDYMYYRLNEKSISRNISEKYVNNYKLFFQKYKQLLIELEILDFNVDEHINKKVYCMLINMLDNTKNITKSLEVIKNNDFFNNYINILSFEFIIIKWIKLNKITFISLFFRVRKNIRIIKDTIHRCIRSGGKHFENICRCISCKKFRG